LAQDIGLRSTTKAAHNPKVVGSNPTSATYKAIPEPGLPALFVMWRAVNKRKRVALAKRRTKKRKLKARAQAAR
jgi:hypothetical protein